MNLQICECERLPFLGKKCPFYAHISYGYCRFVTENGIAPVKEMNREHTTYIEKIWELKIQHLCTQALCPLVGKIITEWEIIA